MMTYKEFQAGLATQANPSKLETWIAFSNDQVANALGNDPSQIPDGGEWLGEDGQGMGIVVKPDGSRWAYRNYCQWEEDTLPGGQTGIYTHADALFASRF